MVLTSVTLYHSATQPVENESGRTGGTLDRSTGVVVRNRIQTRVPRRKCSSAIMGCGIGTLRSELLDHGSIVGQLQTHIKPEAEDVVNDMQDILDMDTMSFYII